MDSLSRLDEACAGTYRVFKHKVMFYDPQKIPVGAYVFGERIFVKASPCEGGIWYNYGWPKLFGTEPDVMAKVDTGRKLVKQLESVN